MDIPGLELNFKVLYLLGGWYPKFENNKKRILHLLYGTIVRSINLMHVALGFAGFFFQSDVESLIRLININILEAVAVLKPIMIQMKHKEIIEMLKILNLDICTSNDESERDILNIYRNKARYVVKMYFIICSITGAIMMIAPMISNSGVNGPSLPFRSERFYNVNNIFVYVLTYFHDLFIVMFAMPIDVFSEGLISGIMILTCGQYDLLYDRLLRATTYHEIRNCIRHHQQILKFTKCIQDVFGGILLVKFLLGLICMSCLTFAASWAKTNPARLDSIFLLISIFSQLLLHCWNGNELFIKSQDVAVKTLSNRQWINLSVKSKKALLIMAIRSYSTSELKAGSICNLSLEVFMAILKASYSAFNVLQQISTD